MRGEGGEIVGVMIHVVTIGDLAGATVTAAIVRDDAIAVLEEEHHLRVPVVGGEWPAVGEDDGLAGTPVFVEDFGAVFGGDGGHGNSPIEDESRTKSTIASAIPLGASLQRGKISGLEVDRIDLVDELAVLLG